VTVMVDQNTPNFKLPFGFAWGATEIQVKKLLAGAQVKIVNTRRERDEEIWEVAGLVQTGLKETLFVFRNSSLITMEMLYQVGDWDTARYDDFFQLVQKRIENESRNCIFIPPFTNDSIERGSALWGYKATMASTAICDLKLWSSDSNGYHETVAVRYEYLNP